MRPAPELHCGKDAVVQRQNGQLIEDTGQQPTDISCKQELVIPQLAIVCLHYLGISEVGSGKTFGSTPYLCSSSDLIRRQHGGRFSETVYTGPHADPSKSNNICLYKKCQPYIASRMASSHLHMRTRRSHRLRRSDGVRSLSQQIARR